jgi:hypothetical protein
MNVSLRRLVRMGGCVPLTLLCAWASCKVSDGELGRRRPFDGGGTGCELASPVVHVQGHPTCTGRLASSFLSNALCTCGNVQVPSLLVTRGFDSGQGPFQENKRDQGGASVGVNGSYLSSLAQGANIGGSFSMAAMNDLTVVGSLVVRGDLWAAGNVTVLGAIVVARNAWFGGSCGGVGGLTVAGALHHGGTISGVLALSSSDQPGAVVVPKPCPCEPGDLLDIGGIVEAARLDNDNASLGISPDQYASMTGSATWSLSCGRAYLSGIGGGGSLTVRVTGRSAIFVDGSIGAMGDLHFDVAPGAEIDVFVKGNVAALGRLVLANKDRPSAGRLWVGGSQPITLVGPWVGNLYAPHADVTAHVALDVWGSIFADNFSSDLSTTFVFDRSIIETGGTCEAPQPSDGECRTCGVCSGGSACVSGTCGPCLADTDCCGLSTCANGTCAPWLDVQSTRTP